jgi:two-component system response regulator MprA
MRLLIVDDDPATRDMLERGLREELFRVETVGDGASAEARATAGAFDLILLDAILPDHDGFTVCRRLRARHVDTPILFLTGRHALEDRVRGLDAGADDYLVKPFAFEELLARVRALLRRGRTRHGNAVLSYGPVEIDQRDHVVRVNGTVVVMTATEFRLMEYLLLRAEAVVTRDELASHVWGDTPGPESNVIDVYIGQVRRKLEPAGVPLVHTVRGFGYTLSKGRV